MCQTSVVVRCIVKRTAEFERSRWVTWWQSRRHFARSAGFCEEGDWRACLCTVRCAARWIKGGGLMVFGTFSWTLVQWASLAFHIFTWSLNTSHIFGSNMSATMDTTVPDLSTAAALRKVNIFHYFRVIYFNWIVMSSASWFYIRMDSNVFLVCFLQVRKPLVERKRRERINTSMDQLKSLVLMATNKNVIILHQYLHCTFMHEYA